MKIISYTEKLNDDRWKKKRSIILERDQCTCQICKAANKTLNVHHKYYLKGREPWDYPNELLVTLCEDCHEEVTNVIENANYLVRCNIDIFRLTETVRLMDIVSRSTPYDIILTTNILNYIRSLDRIKLLKWVRFFAKKGEEVNG